MASGQEDEAGGELHELYIPPPGTAKQIEYADAPFFTILTDPVGHLLTVTSSCKAS
jgi:hypothetical protein